MASADITGQLERLKGQNSPSNYVHSDAYAINGTEFPGILAADTHDLFFLPSGVALKGLQVVSLDTATGGTASVASFKAAIEGSTATAEVIGGTIALGDLAKGDVSVLSPSKIHVYEKGKRIKIQLTNAAAFTKLDLIVIADYVPVDNFITAG